MVVGHKLKVTVINGRGLKCKDSKKEVAPYCVLQSGGTCHQTKYISNNSNPQWNEDFVFDVNPGCEVLSFSIWHKNTSISDVVIGYAFVDFGTCKQNEKTTISIQLQGIYSGEIKLNIFPMYETTASKVGRLEREILLLTYEVTTLTSRNDFLAKQNNELTQENEDLVKTNKLLVHEKNTLLEYDILSCVSPGRSRRTFSSQGYDVLSSGSPKSLCDLSGVVFDCDPDGKQNGLVDHEEFDIISERDIAYATYTKNIKNTKINMASEKLIYDVKKKSDVNDFAFRFTSTCEHDQSGSEGVEILEDEVDRSHRKHKQDKCEMVNTISLNEAEADALISRITTLEEENTELKLFIREMQLVTGDELNQLIEELESKEECEQCDVSIKNKITQIRRLKFENDVKITLLRELISSLSESTENLQEDESVGDEADCNDSNTNVDGDEPKRTKKDKNKLDETEDEETFSMKSPNEPDVIKEYFWDEYLPISTGHSNNDLESTDKIVEDVTHIVDDITDDIDDFIKNNYFFHSGNTSTLRSDPELYTRSEIEEENEHFKDINIRLIKENEELDGCLQLLQVQVQNLKKIQTILFDQLTKRAPTYMSTLLDKFNDYSEVLNEDQVTLYKSQLGNVLDEIVTIATGEVEFKDSPGMDSYKFAVSLLHHQLSATT